MNHLGLVLVKTTETLASLHTEADLRYHVEVGLHTEAGGEGRVEEEDAVGWSKLAGQIWRESYYEH